MRLENVDSPEKLKHLYKLRAMAHVDNYPGTILLGNFEFEFSSCPDYIKNLEIESKEKEMCLYVLGTISHEIAHKYEYQIDLDEYQNIVEEEKISHGKEAVSEYVYNHINLYKSNKNLITREDFADAIRIYVTNPSYLEENYPLRFDFIVKNMPFVKAGGAFEAII